MITDIAAQAQRQRDGRAFEDVIIRILNERLHGLQAVRGNRRALSEVMGDTQARELAEFARLPVKNPCTQSQVDAYPDADIFVVAVPSCPRDGRYSLVAIISCKVSIGHGRHPEVCFWSRETRSSTQIRYVCVTEDRAMYAPRARSEFGVSCDQGTEVRRLLESCTDRVYIAKRFEGPTDPTLTAAIAEHAEIERSRIERVVFDDPAHERHTAYCHQVRPLDDLISDLRRWQVDAADTCTCYTRQARLKTVGGLK